MIRYPDIDPVAISLGPIAIHWYAISYLVGIGVAWWALAYRANKRGLPWNSDQISDLAFYVVLGVVLGGRIGYILFYNFDTVLDDPLSALRIWEGGMSFHGGMLGVSGGLYAYARLHGRSFFSVLDFISPGVPIALGSGRLGNFANAELPGRITDVPWALVYPGDMVARHPSSLYQFLLEGPVLFCLLWFYSQKPRPEMAVTGLFLIGYGSLRMISEFFRAPDPHIGFIAFDWVTMGQALSLPMVLLGLFLMGYAMARVKRNQ